MVAAGSGSAANVAVEARLPMNSNTPTSEGVGGFNIEFYIIFNVISVDVRLGVILKAKNDQTNDRKSMRKIIHFELSPPLDADGLWGYIGGNP